MSLTPGIRLGPYEVLAALGSGGMGEVYRARDARLGRDVALKVIPEPVAGDALRLQRFETEARAAGALAHPNLLTIHDVGRHEGRHYIVSELLEGQTLRDAVSAAGLPWRKAVAWAVQIAHGLAAAHEQGIVHRDLKPENLFLTRDGRIKILDFGLAKATGSGPLGEKPTAALDTAPGTMLGTAGYASPEQVRGLAVDARSDLFSLGAVLYELLTGRRAFAGATSIDSLYAILNEDPLPVDASHPLPPSLVRIVHRCLEKRPEERFQCARDLALALAGVDHDGAAGPPDRRLSARAGIAVALAAAAVGAGLSAVLLLPRGRATAAAEPPVVRYVTHSGQDEDPVAAPDGRTMAFVSSRDGRQRIWLAHLQSGEEVPLTEGPVDDHPRFSRDGSALLFVRVDADGRGALYRVPVLGGEPRRVIDDARAGGEWSPDGRRLAFVRQTQDSPPSAALWVAAADGSGARELVRVPALWATPPRWAPDGQRIAFARGQGAAVAWSTLVVDADSGETTRLAPPLTFGVLSVPAWCCEGRALLFMQSESGHGRLGGRLVRQEVPSGRSTTILREEAMGSGLDRVGSDGVVFDVYATQGNLREERLDQGPSGGRWLTRGIGDDRQPAYAPDGSRILFSSNRSGNLDLWELALPGGRLRRLTDHAADDLDPHVARDGRLLWSSRRSGSFEIWAAEADGSSPRQVSHDGFDAENPAVTPDGRWIVYASSNPPRQGLWKLRADGGEEAKLVDGFAGLPEISPDGALVLFSAYRPPITFLRVVRLVDGQPVDFQIALGSTVFAPRTRFIRGRARWTPDGRAIAFVDQDEKGVSGIFVQDFRPGQDTTRSRRRLAGFDPERVTESFGLSPDGRGITVATRQIAAHVLQASGVPGLDR